MYGVLRGIFTRVIVGVRGQEKNVYIRYSLWPHAPKNKGQRTMLDRARPTLILVIAMRS